MKKTIVFVMCIVMLTVFSGCGSGSPDKGEMLDIVCTAFPQYDWAKNITNGVEKVNVTLICDNGTDMHSYQATAGDIMDINTADILVRVGGEADKWAGESVSESSAVTVVSLIDIMEKNDVHLPEFHEHDEACGHGHEHSESTDEHVWLSLNNAVQFTKQLAEVISDVDSQNRELYMKNAGEYIGELSALDEKYTAVCEAAENKVIVVADRFPFAYLADDYGIESFAAFPGCSADTDASFDTVIYLASKLDEYSLCSVAVTENPDVETVEAIISNTLSGEKNVIEIDSLQSVTRKDIDAGTTYISVMTENLASLSQLLTPNS